MGLGFTGAGGLAGGNAALQDILAQRKLVELQAQKQKQQEFENSIATRTLDQNDELKRMSMAATLEAQQGARQDKLAGTANTMAEQVPPGVYPEKSPMVGVLRSGGRGDLVPPQMQLPAKGFIGGATTPAAGGVMGGRLMTQATGVTAPTQSPGDVPSGNVVKQPTFNQANTATDNARADAALANRPESRIPNITDSTGRRVPDLPGVTPMPPHEPAQPNPQPQLFTGPDGKQHAVQFVGGRAVEIPLPTGFKKQGAVTENRLESATAVYQTGNDIISQLSDPAFINTVGPALGRANTLRDFIGNPPPEFSQLAGQIESYALANMGVHGMRSATGAEHIKALLDKHHTPESLIAAIRGLNSFAAHFMENNERSVPDATGGAGGGAPKVGDTKTFPNGKKGTFDGTGWVQN